MTATSAFFNYLDVFGTSYKLEVPHQDLKCFRPTDKNRPMPVEPKAVASLMPDKSDVWKKELEKVEVQAAVLKNCMEQLDWIIGMFFFKANLKFARSDNNWIHLLCRNSLLELGSLLFMDNHKVFTAKKINKGALRIFPFGSVQKVKEDSNVTKGFKIFVTVVKSKTSYQVLQPKVDLNKKNGIISTFHWIQVVDEEEKANLCLGEWKYNQWLSIPCLKPKEQLNAGVQLTFCKPGDAKPGDADEEASASAKKKARKS